MAERKKLYDQLSELMKGDYFGYGEELVGGDEAFERLLDEGVIAGSDGKRVPGKKERSEKDRAEMLGKLLEKGEPIYIYKKGEEYPREVRMDKKSGRLLTSPKRLDELRPEEQIQKPRKPLYFEWMFDLAARFWGGRWGACRKWDSYNKQQEALKNVREQKRIDRRRRFDPILNGTGRSGKQREKNAPESVTEKSGEKTQEPVQTSPEAEKKLSPELQLLRNLEKEKQLQEQLRQLREENARLEKGLEGKGSVKNEKTEPTQQSSKPASPIGTEPTGDAELAQKLQNEEQKKLEEEQKQIKSDEEFAKSLQEEESKKHEKQEKTQPDEVDGLLDKLRGGDKNKQLPENVEKNLRKLYDDAQKSRRVLSDALSDPKNEKLAGGNTVANIVAYENIKNSINIMENDPELLDNISSEGFVQNWKGAARLSPDVVYASDYLHDKQFFEKNVLSEEGLQKMSRSMDRGINKVIVQQGLNKNGFSKERDIFWGPSNEAEKMAMEEEKRKETVPPQEDEIKVGKQPRKRSYEQSVKKQNEPKPVHVTHHPLEQDQPTNQPQPGAPALK